MHNCSTPHTYHKQIAAFLAGHLAPDDYQTLRGHLRTCPTCRAHYDKLRRIEEELAPEAGLSSLAVERLMPFVVPAQQPRASRMRRAQWAAAAALAASLAVALLWWRPFSGPRDTFHPRGHLPQAQPAALVLFLINSQAQAVTQLPTDAVARIPTNSLLQLAYNNTHFQYSAVIGLNEAYQVHWYHPASPETAQAIQQQVQREPFGNAWRLTSPPGMLRLFALFSSHPIDAQRLSAAVARVRKAQQPLSTLTQLPLDDAHQDSLLIEVLP